MKLNRLFPFGLAAALTACGGGSSQSANPEFTEAAPTYSNTAITQTDGDPTPPAAGDVVTRQDATTPTCHPHLLDRSNDIMKRVNRHFHKMLAHVQDLIADHPHLASGTTHTWENVKDGIDRKLTIDRVANADGSATFNYKLEMKQTTQATFVTVLSGEVTQKGHAGAADAGASLRERSGTATFDYDALKTVIPASEARGSITDTFDSVNDPAKGEKRTASVALHAFISDDDSGHTPRTANFVWERESGIGGSFAFQDQVVIGCSATPSATSTSTLSAVERWYKASGGAVHGRTDATAVGGSIASGNAWEAVTCGEGHSTTSPAEGYWMIKEEDASGATVTGQADTSGASPCDALFGAVPSVSNNATDFNFATLSFTTPAPFPNQW